MLARARGVVVTLNGPMVLTTTAGVSAPISVTNSVSPGATWVRTVPPSDSATVVSLL